MLQKEPFSKFILESQESAPMRFLENVFPWKMQVLRRIAHAILPPHLYTQFVAWQNRTLTNELFIKINNVVGRKIKVVNRAVANFGPKYAEYKLHFKDTRGDTHAQHIFGFGHSVASNADALSIALGEFVERYALARDWSNHIKIHTKARLKGRAVETDAMPHYLDWQKEKVNKHFATNRDTQNTDLPWVLASPLHGWRKKYVPAQRVFWIVKRKGEQGIVCHPTSNGNGGGFSKEEAILSGLYELIERDSFMCFWLLALSPEQIDIETIKTPTVQKLKDKLKRYALDAYFLDITTSLEVPAVACVVIDRSNPDDPKVSVGAACGLSANKLFDKSLMEALVVQRHHWMDVSSKSSFKKVEREGLFSDESFDKENIGERILFWRGREAIEALDFLLKGKKCTFGEFIKQYSCRNFASPQEEFIFVKKTILPRLLERGEGYRPYVYSAQHPILKLLKYHVVGMVVPQLFPLYLIEHMATLNITNMHHWEDTVVAHGGKWDGTIKNVYPHPFP